MKVIYIFFLMILCLACNNHKIKPGSYIIEAFVSQDSVSLDSIYFSKFYRAEFHVDSNYHFIPNQIARELFFKDSIYIISSRRNNFVLKSNKSFHKKMDNKSVKGTEDFYTGKIDGNFVTIKIENKQMKQIGLRNQGFNCNPYSH